MSIVHTRWDIFCKVIDNYGDVGVSWRLATQLAQAHHMRVRFWIDKPEVLADLCTAFKIKSPKEPVVLCKHSIAIEVCHWQENVDYIANVVISMFGCTLPNHYLVAMQHHLPCPLWYNLEYLSAETWVDRYHGMPSLKQNAPLIQHFFVPGFSEKSGGLLRDVALLERRDRWQEDVKNSQALFDLLNLPADTSATYHVCVFCYPNPALISLFKVWSKSKAPITVMMPTASALKSVEALFDVPLKSNQLLRLGSLNLKILPFVDQTIFTRLLWSCDCNIVRGEDSFVSALWAAKPFIWHVYPQHRAAHLIKLQAFIAHYTAHWDTNTASLWQTIQERFNQHQNIAKLWPLFFENQKMIVEHAKSWAYQQAQHSDLATKLVQDANKKLLK
ncbi:MAG: elongation factor P maturation arginine rhamnosyltransferase EarP [Neisseriales bacterium]|nr:MAG: elongation factor P maturation arginine rhamnosyltransferase EarP [Neisseriales bacterium]